MEMQRVRATGVTLIELLIVISIVAVLSAMAMPALGNLKQAGASRSARSALSVAINQARISAAMRRQQVVVCPSADQRAAIATSAGTTAGWFFLTAIGTASTKPRKKSLRSIRPKRPDSQSSAAVAATAFATSPTVRRMAAT